MESEPRFKWLAIGRTSVASNSVSMSELHRYGHSKSSQGRHNHQTEIDGNQIQSSLPYSLRFHDIAMIQPAIMYWSACSVFSVQYKYSNRITASLDILHQLHQFIYSTGNRKFPTVRVYITKLNSVLLAIRWLDGQVSGTDRSIQIHVFVSTVSIFFPFHLLGHGWLTPYIKNSPCHSTTVFFSKTSPS